MRASASRRFALLCACLAALGFAATAHSALAATPYVDGIADQNLGLWNGNFVDASGYNEPFYDYFPLAWVGSPPSHIRYARFVTAPDAIAQGGACESNLISWYRTVTSLHLIPVIAVWDVAEGGCADDGIPSSAAYTSDVQSLVSTLDGLGAAPLQYLEAWNEPNSDGVSATVAASFWLDANKVCSTDGCTALAGDFVDNDPDQGGQKLNPGCATLTWNVHFKPYIVSYVKALGSTRPTIWGFHPYYAVNCEQSSSLATLAQNLPSPAGQIWFTEVGAWECVKGQSPARGATRQAADATYLVNQLMSPSQPGSPTNVFWYELAAPGYTQNCAKYADSALYEANTAPGTLLARPAAAIVFGPSPANATSTPASGVGSSQATLNGTVTGGGIYDTSYYFQYGTTSLYGSTTPVTQLGPGLATTPVSATLTGLRSGVTYYFRLVVSDSSGAPAVDGAPETFTTSWPQISGGGSAFSGGGRTPFSFP